MYTVVREASSCYTIHELRNVKETADLPCSIFSFFFVFSHLLLSSCLLGMDPTDTRPNLSSYRSSSSRVHSTSDPSDSEDQHSSRYGAIESSSPPTRRRPSVKRRSTLRRSQRRRSSHASYRGQVDDAEAQDDTSMAEDEDEDRPHHDHVSFASAEHEITLKDKQEVEIYSM